MCLDYTVSISVLMRPNTSSSLARSSRTTKFKNKYSKKYSPPEIARVMQKLCHSWSSADRNGFSAKDLLPVMDRDAFALIDTNDFDIDSIMMFGLWHMIDFEKSLLNKWPISRLDGTMLKGLLSSSKGDAEAIHLLYPRVH